MPNMITYLAESRIFLDPTCAGIRVYQDAIAQVRVGIKSRIDERHYDTTPGIIRRSTGTFGNRKQRIVFRIVKWVIGCEMPCQAFDVPVLCRSFRAIVAISGATAKVIQAITHHMS